MQVSNILLSPNRSLHGPGSATGSMEVEVKPKKKMSKFDSLKPLLTLLESTLVTHGLDQRAADMVVLDIAERLVTAGYGWDKVLQYQAKVSSWGHLDSAV